MIKDFLLIGILLIVVVKYILLHREFIKQRDYFIDTLSHSIRVSVIAQIRGMDLLQLSLKKTEFEDLIAEINKGCKYTYDMITMLMNTYRYQKGEQVLNYETINIEEIVSLSCNQLEFLAVEKDIVFKCELEEDSVLEADKYGIKKAIYTILSTAIYNSSKKSPIYIKTTKFEQYIEISVIYHGKSLTNEECRKIYSNNPQYGTVGQGIKMHLCKKIIDYHHGIFTIQNCGEKINSFTIKLPLTKRKTCLKTLLSSAIQACSSSSNSN